jgi:hydroxymethylbilane synthase
MRIGTRGSALALAQARLVAGSLEDAEIVIVRTTGDRQMLDHPNGGGNSAPAQSATARVNDKARWVAELEQALQGGDIDLAVHSAKDVPGEIGKGLELLGAPPRAAVQDALIGVRSLEELPTGACVGTSSVRRAAQLRAVRGDLEVVSLHGNVDTRLRRLANEVTKGDVEIDKQRVGAESLHAIVLASAGLWRLGREHDIGCTLDATRFVPAPGQGALALQARVGDERVRAAVAHIIDDDTTACLHAERAAARALGASCNTPLGAHAVPAGCGCLHMRAWVGLPDGSQWLADELLGGFYDPDELGRRVAERLDAVGASELLARAEEMAVDPS